MQLLERAEYVQALLAAQRPGSERILAFYDHRIGAICRDATLLLVPLDDHLCHRGDGLFESICFRQGRIFALDAHMARLMEGAKALKLEPPCSWQEIHDIVLATVRAAEVADGDIRLFLSRGPGGFGISTRECPRAGLYVVVLKANLFCSSLYEKGVTAFTSAIPPKQEYLARIKNTNYLPNVFMSREAEERGEDVAVSFDEDGAMGEAAIANLAILDSQGRFVHPDLTRILAGTTLLCAMHLAQSRTEVLSGTITHDDIFSAREVFLLTSSTLCVSVVRFDGRPLGWAPYTGTPGPFAQWLRKELFTQLWTQGTAFEGGA